MGPLGLLASLAYIPGYTGAYIPTQWVVFSCLLPLALWCKGRMSLGHWLGAAFLAYAFASAFWAADPFDAVWGLWLLSIAALAFWLGSTCLDLRNLWIGLALGLTVSSVIATLQFFGIRPVLGGTGLRSSGLLFNPLVLGSASALVIVGLLSERLYWFIPGVVPAFALAQSRGAIFALLCGAWMVYFPRPLPLLLGVLAVAFFVTSFPSAADLIRFQLWWGAGETLTLFGYGPGSFLGFFYASGDNLIHPEYAHNDLLQLVFEYGIGSVALVALLCLGLSQTDSPEWPVLVTFTILGLVSFPFYTPLTALAGACAAGRCVDDWALARSYRRHVGLEGLPRNAERSLPLQSGT